MHVKSTAVQKVLFGWWSPHKILFTGSKFTSTVLFALSIYSGKLQPILPCAKLMGKLK